MLDEDRATGEEAYMSEVVYGNVRGEGVCQGGLVRVTQLNVKGTKPKLIFCQAWLNDI